MTKILDCTLRDGGYYNDWNFPLELARRTISSLQQSGVDIIEVGLKSAPDNQCSGLFKYCNEDYLGFLADYSDSAFSFMLNVKEFVAHGRPDFTALDQIIRPAGESVFGMCRLAVHYSDINALAPLHDYFNQKGYRVGINLMGISLLDQQQITEAMQVVEQEKPEVFYVADSFGSMLPGDVSTLVQTLRQQYTGPIGIHTHDNQGLAFANSLQAISDGVEYIDSTLTGMGRGAGNLSTEQILLWLQNRGVQQDRYHSSKLLDIIHDYYTPLKDHYKWGFNYVYMLSGLNNTHPVYCMELCDGNKFSMAQITAILENIPPQNRSVYSRQALAESIREVPKRTDNDPAKSLLPRFPVATNRSQRSACLLVSTGTNIENYREAIANAVARHQWQVIECNNTGVVDQFSDRLTVVLNGMRLGEIADQDTGLARTIVTGERAFDRSVDSTLYHFPYRIDDVAISDEEISIPDFEAGQYAISLAAALGYRTMFLAGFSGYQDQTRNLAMENYFDSLGQQVGALSLVSVTPTHYRNLAQQSIYTL